MYGANVTWSGVARLAAFKNFSMPFPLVENVVVDPKPPSFESVLIPRRTRPSSSPALSNGTIPLAGVMQPSRKPDFIIAYDASQETDYGWQNGTNLLDTYT
ncbi:hypothetical protein DACRYDRAFT_111877 [Dacryopinax primogenitus]|uniref:Lysophospholipase n=1 Tax=Dacryopinax primogenitus (strain DJM 731) TaxID=1858805 RepID=M5FR43_DACPD|nr:uncharacterized protein DACRYDRAFT_111877 [Dacryopinax primogenitus]EJT97334.1 hypothetical protein DACRYDRAFT_111877 [Dacryopinax primogenitus]